MFTNVTTVINPSTFSPETNLMVANIPIYELKQKKTRGEELTLQEFAVLVLIEAFENA